MLSWLSKAEGHTCVYQTVPIAESLLTDLSCICAVVAKSGVKQEQQLVKPKRFPASRLSLAQRQLLSLPCVMRSVGIRELSPAAWAVKGQQSQ